MRRSMWWCLNTQRTRHNINTVIHWARNGFEKWCLSVSLCVCVCWPRNDKSNSNNFTSSSIASFHGILLCLSILCTISHGSAWRRQRRRRRRQRLHNEIWRWWAQRQQHTSNKSIETRYAGHKLHLGHEHISATDDDSAIKVIIILHICHASDTRTHTDTQSNTHNTHIHFIFHVIVMVAVAVGFVSCILFPLSYFV